MDLTLWRKFFFLLCLLCIVVLSSVRSRPVYGKLDFLLVDGHPWWRPWQPMIEQVLQDGNTPILSDMATSTVLRAVFAQKAVSFRFVRRYSHLDVDTLVEMNQGEKKNFPAGALVLLLDLENRKLSSDATYPKQAEEGDNSSIVQLLAETARAMADRPGKHPYRCLINLHGFTPSWVPIETGHWSPQWADTARFYEFRGRHGKEMESLLMDNPPENCTVYF